MRMRCVWALLVTFTVYQAGADPMVYTAPDGTTSAHLSGGLSHNVHRHDEECAAGKSVNCQVQEGWEFGVCTTTCGQGTKTRSRAVTVEVAPHPMASFATV
jgi:hypothetical protein